MADEKKRNPATAAKQRYNEKNYTRVGAWLPKELVRKFKEKCAAENIPLARVINKAIEDFLNK